MKRAHIALVVSAALLALSTGCSDDSSAGPGQTTVEQSGPGAFGLSRLDGLGREQTSASPQVGEDVSFDLGPIRASTAFYFLLYNVGLSPITGVTLSIGDSAYAVYPTSIDTLMPRDLTGMLPIVKVSAYHGTPMEGVGNRPCLPMGRDSATLVIRGATRTLGGADTAVVLTAQIALTALVMAVDLRLGCTPVDIEGPEAWTGSVRMLPGMGSVVPNYGTSASGAGVTPGEWVLLSNRGNVTIGVAVYYWDHSLLCTIGPVTAGLAVGDSVFVRRQSGPDLTFCLDGGHTVCDSRVLQPQSDGRVYFYVGCNGNVLAANSCPPSDTATALNVYSP